MVIDVSGMDGILIDPAKKKQYSRPESDGERPTLNCKSITFILQVLLFDKVFECLTIMY